MGYLPGVLERIDSATAEVRKDLGAQIEATEKAIGGDLGEREKKLQESINSVDSQATSRLESAVTTLTQAIASKADDGHTHIIADVAQLQTKLDEKVDKARELPGDGTVK